MTRMRKAIYVAVVVLAVAGLTLPLTLRAGASSVATASSAGAISTPGSGAIRQEAFVSTSQLEEQSKAGSDQAKAGKISKDVLETLGVRRLPKSKLGKVPGEAAQQITAGASSHITPLPPGGRLNSPGSSVTLVVRASPISV